MRSDRIELVTPSTAAAWLRSNENNRRRDDSRVALYLRSMQRGEWRAYLGDPIRFANHNGTEILIDGQHRLTAVVEYGHPIEFRVIRGLSVDDRRFIDQGKARTGSDIARWAGIPNATNAMSVARRVMAWDRGDHLLALKDLSRWTSNEVVVWIQNNPLLIDSVRIGRTVRAGCRPIRASTAGAAHFILARDHDRERAGEFFARLGDGQNLSAGSPILALRNRSVQDAERRIRVCDGELMERIRHVFQAWIDGRELTRYQTPRSSPWDPANRGVR